MAREDGNWIQDYSTGDNLKVNADGSLNVNGALAPSVDQLSGFRPDPSSRIDGAANLLVDSEQQLITRGTVYTDELSFRDDMSGSTLLPTITGTVSVTNGNVAVTGSGTSFTTDLLIGQYIRLSAHANSTLTRIATIESDTALTLETGYLGATGSGAAVKSNWMITIGTGGAQSVGSSILTIGAGTTNGSITAICREGDYCPFNLYSSVSISQRIANQNLKFGLVDIGTAPTKGVYFQFDGTSNTTVKCVAQSSSGTGDTTTITITLPGGVTTATAQRYEISLSQDNATFLVNDIVVAKIQDHIPGPYDALMLCYTWHNTAAPSSNTNALVDYVYFSNVDQLEVTSNFHGSPVTIQPPVGQPVLKTGTLVTTATTADQVVLTYTVSTGKILYLQYVQMDGYITTLPGNANPVRLGTMSLEIVAGTKVFTVERFHVPFGGSPFPMNVPIYAGTVVRVVVTPGATTSYTWRANFGGYEI